MDPFSLTVGIIGVVDGGLSLAEKLKGKIDDYRGAGREVEELAHEIDLCATLLDVLGDSLERPESAYPRNVVKQTWRLVGDMKNVFTDIEKLMVEFDYSVKASASYVIHAQSIRGQHDKLKSLQLSFIFLQSICSPQRTPAPAVTSGGGLVPQLGSFQGTIQQVPIYNGNGTSSEGAPITYTATLTLHAPPLGQWPAAPPSMPLHAGQPMDHTERLEQVKKNKRLKRKLSALTSNPFFSREAFGSLLPKSNRSFAPQMAHYDLEEAVPGMEEEFERQQKAKRAEKAADDILAYLFDDGNEDDEEEPKVRAHDVGVEVVQVESDGRQSSQSTLGSEPEVAESISQPYIAVPAGTTQRTTYLDYSNRGAGNLQQVPYVHHNHRSTMSPPSVSLSGEGKPLSHHTTPPTQ